MMLFWRKRGRRSRLPGAPYREETSMKELIKQYLDDGISRRQLMTGLSALGMTTVAAQSVAQSSEGSRTRSAACAR